MICQLTQIKPVSFCQQEANCDALFFFSRWQHLEALPGHGPEQELSQYNTSPMTSGPGRVVFFFHLIIALPLRQSFYLPLAALQPCGFRTQCQVLLATEMPGAEIESQCFLFQPFYCLGFD